jgi:hypothetical protein
MSPCRLADRCHRFRQTCSLYLPGGRWAAGHPNKCHIHDTFDHEKVKCHMCPQIRSEYILFAGVNIFRIIATAYTLTYKNVFQLTCNQHVEVRRSLHNCGCVSRALYNHAIQHLTHIHSQTHSEKRYDSHTTHDMLPQYQVNIMK